MFVRNLPADLDVVARRIYGAVLGGLLLLSPAEAVPFP